MLHWGALELSDYTFTTSDDAHALTVALYTLASGVDSGSGLAERNNLDGSDSKSKLGIEHARTWVS